MTQWFVVAVRFVQTHLISSFNSSTQRNFVNSVIFFPFVFCCWNKNRTKYFRRRTNTIYAAKSTEKLRERERERERLVSSLPMTSFKPIVEIEEHKKMVVYFYKMYWDHFHDITRQLYIIMIMIIIIIIYIYIYTWTRWTIIMIHLFGLLKNLFFLFVSFV